MDQKTAKKLAETLKGQKVGGWEVGRYLNYGKSAFVCESSKNRVTAAIKIYDSILIEEFGEDVQTKRIERQLSLVGKAHPNLVKIYDGGRCKEHGLFFLVMERVNEVSLENVIPAFPRDKIETIISQIASAAKFLEELGLAHRDIKPSNIAITEDLQHATLLDFGVIRPLTDDNITDATKRKAFIGTLRYSSPEFLLRQEKESVEGWRAITFYQLGAVLHDMIMRYPLFRDESEPYARLVRAVCEDVPKIQADDVDTELIQIANLCLLKKPELRLRHVNWGDFSFPRPKLCEIDEAKNRIKSRRKLASIQTQEENAIEQQTRKVEQFIYDVTECIEAAINNTCVGNDVFPPIEFQCEYDTHKSVLTAIIKMEPSEKHALKLHLKVYVCVEILDILSKLLRVKGVALLHESDSEPKDIDVTTELFEGVFDKRVILDAIDRLMHIVMDEAQHRSGEIKGKILGKNKGGTSEWIIPNLTNKREHK